jgi:hypothetical protein
MLLWILVTKGSQKRIYYGHLREPYFCLSALSLEYRVDLKGFLTTRVLQELGIQQRCTVYAHSS